LHVNGFIEIEVPWRFDFDGDVDFDFDFDFDWISKMHMRSPLAWVFPPLTPA
jgi:hypothetical protein